MPSRLKSFVYMLPQALGGLKNIVYMLPQVSGGLKNMLPQVFRHFFLVIKF